MPLVLCVDDDRTALRTVVRVLRTEAETRAVGSAAEALRSLDPTITAVVADHRMPGTSGTALLAEVRAFDDTIGRILVTAYADPDVLMEAINRGHVDRYVAKPWDPRELRGAVRAAIVAAESERDRRRLAEENARAYAQLRELDALKSRFLAMAAHELRTPLHVVGAALEGMAETGLSETAGALLGTARASLAWLGRSVSAMTELERLARPGRASSIAVCLASVVRRVLEETAPLCARRRLELRRQVPAVARVCGDPSGLYAALMNLVLNAIRFTPDGGTITVRLDDAVGGRRVVSVCDTGVGVAPALAARLGEPFVTGMPVDTHHSDPIAFGSGGVGLGLATARAVAMAHGGRFWFESRLGIGSTFYLEVPAGVD